VLQLGDQLHLVPELRRALPGPRRQPLHGDLRAAGKDTLNGQTHQPMQLISCREEEF